MRRLFHFSRMHDASERAGLSKFSRGGALAEAGISLGRASELSRVDVTWNQRDSAFELYAFGICIGGELVLSRSIGPFCSADISCGPISISTTQAGRACAPVVMTR